MSQPKPPAILYVSSFPPRECGIATFTKDLTTAMDKEFNPAVKSKILALNVNGTSIYNYPRKVVRQINESDIENYINQANEINRSPDVKLVNIQHEYGLYGGEWGDYILFFLELLKKPVIVTMHTVLPNPTEKLKKVTRAITERALGVITMTKSSAQILEDIYGVKKNKIKVIPHGVHHIPFPSKKRAKKKLNLQGRIVLSSFGMINRDKGYEYAIEALPEVVAEYPNLLYLIIGATHPIVRRNEGEIYRNKLTRLVSRLNLKDNVKFYDKYLTLHELIDYLKATDIYLSPTLNPQQAVSGTISYALSCACPVVATANQYAKDVINHERGCLVRFRKSGDIKNALLALLPDKAAQKEMKKNAYFFSRHMTWQNVALSYFELFNTFAKIRPLEAGKLPPIRLDYFKVLTDSFGMIQFANHTKPDKHSGYCLDDNARALIAAAASYNKRKVRGTLALIDKYLTFIKYVQRPDGKFHNYVGFHKKFNGHEESEDSYGRAIWALGYFIANDNLPENMRKKAYLILKKAFPGVRELRSLRAIAFSIIGLCHISKNFPEVIVKQPEMKKKIEEAVIKLSDKLLKQYDKQRNDPEKKDWYWFEDYFTYSNFKIPEALFRAYEITKNKEYLKIAEQSLKFLLDITFEHANYFSPIGQDGWYFRNGKRAYFDQQPEDAASAVEGLVAAFQTTGKKSYKDRAELAFQWFLGKNHLNQMVYDEATGGCYDGLGKFSLNFNQGAESTISYLLARLAIEKITP